MTTPYAKWLIALFIGVTVVITLVLLMHVDEPAYTPPPPPTPGPGPSIAPTAHAAVDPQVWVIVDDLSTITGDWVVRKGYDMSGSKLRIKKGGKSSLYPYNLRYEPGTRDKHPLNCGFYKKLEKDWRLAYCSGYYKPRTAGSAAHRIMLHVLHSKPDSMRLQVGNMLELYLHRVK